MNDQSIQAIQILYHAMLQNDIVSIQKGIETNDFDDIADEIISEYRSGDIKNPDMLSKLISVMHYIENETELSAPMSDEKYDILVEYYNDSTGSQLSGTTKEVPSSEDGTSYHRYPELRGALRKVHFLYKSDVPEHDSRKSAEWFWDKLVATNLRTDLPIRITFSPKYDGHSVVFEMNRTKVEKALTRYKTGLNLGKDISVILGDVDLSDDIPSKFKKVNSYGIKTEVYMTRENLERFRSDMGDESFNQRSAVASILNRKFETELAMGITYLSFQAFQIASTVKVELPKEGERDYVGTNRWSYVGKVGGYFYSYLNDFGSTGWFTLNDKDKFIDHLRGAIDDVQIMIDNGTPIDGVVVTVFNQDIIDKLGRKNDANQFQIAYKLPTGTGRTKIKKITFPVGPCAGTITPLAEVEPIVINHRTIKSVSLSNLDKLQRLDLNLGDEVIIKYDIIPKLYKDDTCKKGNGPKVIIPNSCPVCGAELSETYRCVNPECQSKVSGKIINFITKMRIPNIGIKTVERLVNEGIWTGIESLYHLALQKEDIVGLKGFGLSSFHNMLHGVYSRKELYPHEIMAAIGIPDMAEKTMKKIFKAVDILAITCLTTPEEERVAMLTEIKGIGKKKAEKLIAGIRDNSDLITFLLAKINIKPYEEEEVQPEPDTNVVFTNVRDKAFEEFLRQHGVGVVDTISSKTSAVITSSYLRYRREKKRIDDVIDDELFRQSYGFSRRTKKIQTAEEKGIPIIDLDEYKKKMGYEGE